MNDITLCIFDLNGTLATSFTDGPVIHPLPGRREKLDELRAQGISIAVATNQAGPLWKLATGKEKYPDASHMVDDIYTAMRDLGMTRSFAHGISDAVMIALYDSAAMAVLSRTIREQFYYDEVTTRMACQHALDMLKNDVHQAVGNRLVAFVSIDKQDRKPQPGMLNHLIHIDETDAAHTLYVGDRPEDKAAAQNAGCHFLWASEFFTPEATMGPVIAP